MVLDMTIVDYLYHSLAFCSFFQKPTYRVFISPGLTDYMHSSLASMLDMGIGLILFNSSFLPRSWQANFKPMLSLLLKTATRPAVYVQMFMFLEVHIGDIQARRCFSIAKSLAVDIFFRTWFIDLCTCGIFQAKVISVPIHSLSLLIDTEIVSEGFLFAWIRTSNHTGMQLVWGSKQYSPVV